MAFCQSGVWKGPGGLSGKEMRTATCVGPYYAGVCTATCSAGKAVIAGGCYTAYPGNTWQTAWAVRATYPSSDTTWTCQMGASQKTEKIVRKAADWPRINLQEKQNAAP